MTEAPKPITAAERAAAFENIRRLSKLEYESTSTILAQAGHTFNLAALPSQDTVFPIPASGYMRRKYMKEMASMIGALTQTGGTSGSFSEKKDVNLTSNLSTTTSDPTESQNDTVLPNQSKKKKKKRKKKKTAGGDQVSATGGDDEDGEEEDAQDDDNNTLVVIEDMDNEDPTPTTSRIVSSESTLVADRSYQKDSSQEPWDFSGEKDWADGILTDEPLPLDTITGSEDQSPTPSNKKKRVRKRNRKSPGFGKLLSPNAIPPACEYDDDEDVDEFNTFKSMNVTGNKDAVVVDISNEVKLDDHDAVGTGGCCDLFVGSHAKLGKVALKRPRYTHAVEDVLRRFRKEAEMWCTFNHKHILPFLGTAQLGRHMYLVSPWVEQGNLYEQIKQDPSLDRLTLLCEIAEALVYLHGLGVVHGDIKAQNVLVGDDGRALLCDFGLTKVLDKMVTSTEVKGGGSTRWMAPELLVDGAKTLSSDVYAFSMTIVEVISGRPPFSHVDNNYAVMIEVAFKNQRPRREPMRSEGGISYQQLWELVEKCWVGEPEARPQMKYVLDELQLYCSKVCRP